jgi:hypothetical protein
MSGRETKKQVATREPHPVSPLPTMRIRLHTLRRGTYATDHGLNAIFARGRETPLPASAPADEEEK